MFTTTCPTRNAARPAWFHLRAKITRSSTHQPPPGSLV